MPRGDTYGRQEYNGLRLPILLSEVLNQCHGGVTMKLLRFDGTSLLIEMIAVERSKHHSYVKSIERILVKGFMDYSPGWS